MLISHSSYDSAPVSMLRNMIITDVCISQIHSPIHRHKVIKTDDNAPIQPDFLTQNILNIYLYFFIKTVYINLHTERMITMD